eukprot:382823-Hanusia_phi.AAC.1
MHPRRRIGLDDAASRSAAARLPRSAVRLMPPGPGGTVLALRGGRTRARIGCGSRAVWQLSFAELAGVEPTVSDRCL